MAYPELYLKKNEDKRLRKGHSWVFSNEVDTQRSPLEQFTAGDLVQIIDAEGKGLGTAYVNPQTLICARLLSRKANLKCGSNFFKDRLSNALNLRKKLFSKPYYRLVYGESDGLPGIVIDRFGPVLSVQITTVGMEQRKEALFTALIDLLSPEAIILKNDNSQRQLEGLSMESELAYGKLPEPLIIEENGAKFVVDILGGQKTGWFYDHRSSRAQLASFANGQRVLDLFSYTGAWSIPAAIAGAIEVTCVDASQGALTLAEENAKLNQVQDKMRFVRSDVFDFLKQARLDNELYDIIVLDPPALIKRKKDFKQGYEAYRRLNHLALQVLSKNGILISASCSHHLSRENLHEILRSSGRHIDRHLVFFASGGQGPDHPIDPAAPETEYLKTYFCSVSTSL
ncbi:MAG: class I SAM-dependent rRNA methyltransferase [Methylococcaceae bacterium]|nr:class I SAM-dependent rRNA methyltransferase [Methylococcaceae bacterium]MDZ4155311.1 class I SAM-dependent rRNA methyltransferase [Methylococcales bacterium]MDP2393923.1 class I SAM-dependent rRNA methyltransferase [Methylococcaceae bacterium]MDP3018089.1 class I SAM-dependent rRNA methyltransferase [Methylococcaceae bacterium]MDP3391800.1 class I SAM-dependent rRNA methyltransferase [Methylococcaceae bacterium]